MGWGRCQYILHQEVTQRCSRVTCIQFVPSRTHQQQPEGMAGPGLFPSQRPLHFIAINNCVEQ